MCLCVFWSSFFLFAIITIDLRGRSAVVCLKGEGEERNPSSFDFAPELLGLATLWTRSGQTKYCGAVT